MKEWHDPIEQSDALEESNQQKQLTSAFYPWKEEQALLKCNIDTPHYDPVKEREEETADFECSIEFACALDDLNTYQVGQFSLGKTKAEDRIASWHKSLTPDGNALLTASVRVDEPKTLYRNCFGMALDNVKPVKKGTAKAVAAFVPIKPSIQIYDHLAWPKIGFFYHFIDDVLVNEYQLLGGNKWSFKVTHSTNKTLSSECLSTPEYGFILLPWRLNDTVIARQHLLYTIEKLTQEQLNEIDGTFLDENARLLNPEQIVEARMEKQVYP